MAFRHLFISCNIILVCLLLVGFGCSSSEPQGSDLPSDTAADNRDVVQSDSDPGTDELTADATAELPEDVADAFLFDVFEAVQDSDSGLDAQRDALDAFDGVTPDADAASGDAPDSPGGPCRISGQVRYNNRAEHSGIEIRLGDNSSTSQYNGIVAVTYTDGDGQYLFDGMPYGYYRIYALNGGFTTDKYLEWEIVTCTADSTSCVVRDMTITAAAKIVGHASYPPEAARPDNSGIKVFSRDWSLSTTTDDNGYFEFVVSAGHYEICAADADADFVGKCGEAIDVVDLVVEYEITSLNMGVYDENSPVPDCLSGVITLTGADDSSGISVRADCSGNIVETITDESGAYTLEGLTPGQCMLSFSAPEGSGFEQNADIEVSNIYSGMCFPPPRLYLGRGRNLGSYLSRDKVSNGFWFGFSKDSRYVVFVDSGYRLISYDTVAGQQVVLSENARDFFISPDSSLVAYYRYDATMETLLSIDAVPIAGGEPKEFLWQSEDRYPVLVFSPDSRYFASRNTDGTVTVKDLRSDESRTFCHDKPGSLEFSPDSRLLLCRSSSGYLSVNDVENNLTIFEQSDVSSYAFSLDWSRMVTCRSSGVLDSFDIVAGTVGPFSDDNAGCNMSTFSMSPLGDRVVYVKDTRFLFAANLDDGSSLLLDEAAAVHLFSVTPDSTRIVYATASGTDYDATWTLMQGYLESGNLEQVVSPVSFRDGHVIGKDSDVIFLPTCGNDGTQLYAVHSISLDGTDDGWGDLGVTDFMVYGRQWRINEETGVGLSYNGSVDYIYQGSNEEGNLPFTGGFRSLAADNLSFVSFDDFPGNLVWVWLKDGLWSSIPVVHHVIPHRISAYGDLFPSGSISPDSNWLLYWTYFAPGEAFRSPSYELYQYQSRLNLVDLREIRGQ